MIFVHLLQAASASSTDASALERAISALESDISALEKCVNNLSSSTLPWEHRALLSSALVVLGVLMELWVIRHEWHDETETWALWYGFNVFRLPARPSVCKLWIEIGSVVFIAAGIIGEMGAGLEIASINRSLRAKNEALQGKSAELRGKSDQLVELLHRETEDERVARVEAEESIEWRSLNKEKQSLIASRLNRFAGQPAQPMYNVGDREAELFAFEIGEALQNAKWLVYSPASKADIALPGHLFGTVPRSETGVTVSFPQAGTGNAAGKELIRELTALGFDAVPEQARRLPSAGTSLFIFVEVRPEGPQGDAKLRHDKKLKTTHK